MIRSRIEKENEEVISQFKKFTQISHRSESEDKGGETPLELTSREDADEDIEESPNFAFNDKEVHIEQISHISLEKHQQTPSVEGEPKEELFDPPFAEHSSFINNAVLPIETIRIHEAAN